MQIGIQRLDTVVDGVDETRFIATTAHGEFVACVSLQYKERHCASFRQLFVAERVRRKGIGSELVSRCAEMAKKAGCGTLGAMVEKANEDAMALYEKMGFIISYEFAEDGTRLIVKLLK